MGTDGDGARDAPLQGLRVLEIGGGIAAAFATHLLGGYGADVVRSEGDNGVALTTDEAVYLLAGKRRVVLDDGQLRTLALDADVVVEDQPPGALGARGLGPAALRAERPELIVVSVTPFGQSGPYAGFQATNAVSFALGGIMSLTGDADRPPLLGGGSQAQYLGGLNAFGATATAWLGRLVQGEGDWIDISCQEAAASMVELYVPGTAYGEAVQLRMGNQVRAVWGLYPCIDGYAGAFCLERQIRGLFDALDDPELVDERFTHPLRRLDPEVNDELLAKMYAFFAERTKEDVLALGPRYKVPFGVVMTPADLLASPGLAERGFWDEVDVGGGAGGAAVAQVPGRPFPGLGWQGGGRLHGAGEDTEAVLAELGRTAQVGTGSRP
jgi:crotonobetainyl-CoA:carnitine CoA-transferase CaiB-like acyl-CoA transferase